MNDLIKLLYRHISEHPIDFGDTTAESVLDFLFQAYEESREKAPPSFKPAYEALDQQLEKLPIDECNQLFSVVMWLCREHAKEFFKEGIRWGMALAEERKPQSLH